MRAICQFLRHLPFQEASGGSPALLAGLLVLTSWGPLWGQEGPYPGPDSLATEFQAALRGMGWRAAAVRLHPEALENFHYLITLQVEMDTTGGPIEKLYPQGGLPLYYQKSPEEVFLRVMEVLSRDAPGLIHGLVMRDVDVVGSVPEGELAHVVYRSTADLSGAQPELRVMTLKRDGERWGVLRSQEVDVLVEAFRGITRKVRPPPGGWPGGDTTGRRSRTWDRHTRLLPYPSGPGGSRSRFRPGGR